MLREDLNPIEEAQAFQRLNDEFGLKQEHIGKRLGRSRGAINNSLRMLTLPAEVRESIASGQITESHARALLSIESDRERLDVWRKILSDELTVRQAEEIAKSLKDLPGAKMVNRKRAPRVDANVRAIEDDLRHALGVPVSVRKSASGAGTVVLRFHSEEELEGILTKVTGS
jgi:ParB family chromosome partitioning protein